MWDRLAYYITTPFRTIQKQLALTDSLKIIRRYLVSNVFDGCLTTLAIVVANYIMNNTNMFSVFILGISAGISIFLSGIWGTLFIESAEHKKQLRFWERKLLKKMDNTYIGNAFGFVPFLNSFVDGMAPLMVCFFISMPFLYLLPPTAYYVSITFGFIVNILLGITTAHIAKENILIHVSKFVVITIITLTILLAVNIFLTEQGVYFHY